MRRGIAQAAVIALESNSVVPTGRVTVTVSDGWIKRRTQWVRELLN